MLLSSFASLPVIIPAAIISLLAFGCQDPHQNGCDDTAKLLYSRIIFR
jgi:hypothetical protein